MLGLVAVLVITAILRIGAVVRIDDPQQVPRSHAEGDAPTYYVLAENLIDGIGYRYSADTLPTARRTPGYPLLLAAIFKVFGRDFNAVRGVQCVLDVLTAFLVFALATILLRNTGAALLAALAYALYPPAILSTTYIMTETAYTFLLVLFTLCCVVALRNSSYSLFAASGILIGLATLTRPGVFLLPLVLLVVCIIAKPSSWRGMILLLIAFTITMLPWGLRNSRDMGKFIPTSTLMGANLYKGNHLPSQGSFFTSTDSLLTPQIRAEVATVTEARRDSILRTEAVRMILANKKDVAWLMLKKIPRLWFNLGYGRAPSRRSLALAGLHLVLIVLAVYGYLTIPPDRRFLGVVPITIIKVLSLIHI